MNILYRNLIGILKLTVKAYSLKSPFGEPQKKQGEDLIKNRKMNKKDHVLRRIMAL